MNQILFSIFAYNLVAYNLNVNHIQDGGVGARGKEAKRPPVSVFPL